MTESLPRRLSRRRNIMFPGAAAKRRFDVMTAAMTVLIALWLKASDCTISTGRRYPGSEARGAGRIAHQISPRFITTDRAESTPIVALPTRDRAQPPRWHKAHLATLSHPALEPLQRTARWRANIDGCGVSPNAWPAG